MANTIAIAREQKIFVGKEVTKGTLLAPASCSLIIAAGYGKLTQQSSFTNSPEIINSRDIIDRFQDRTMPGDWSIPVLARPSGTAGTAPMEDVLLECLAGTKTITGGTSVAYTPAIAKPSFSLYMLKDHTVFSACGCSVGAFKAALSTKGALQYDMSGKFMRMYYAGTDALNGAVLINATTIVVTNSKKFSIGSYIEFVEGGVVKNNSNAGYKITAITVATHTLTITPGAQEALDTASVVRGFLPTGTEVGAPVESRLGVAKIDGASFNVQSMEFNIADEPKYLDDEITTSGYTEEYVETMRSISGNLSIYFRENDAQYFYDGLNNTVRTLDMVTGTVAGSIVTIDSNRVSLDVPTTEESDPTIALKMGFLALGTNGEDSFTITYT